MDINTNGRPLKSHEWVLNDLRKQLEEGKLAVGDRLSSVVDLAAQYGVGRSTIREALSVLKAMGLLDIRQGGGTFVKALPSEPPHPGLLHPEWVGRAESLRHILEVRRVLETGCASLAAVSRTEADLAALAGTLRSMEEHLGDEALSEQADVRFHEQIAAATHNPVLADLMASLSQKLHDSMKDTRALWFYAERSSAERLLREHQAIFDAIRSRQPQDASARMEQHITKVEQVLGEKGADVSSR
ncbi:FadR/GntR family transcriptional regulator [Paenibacillus sp. UNC499MF]|uniref:FadR/GntR family transcriptional regulator n=1 Tax=Paenibacillus sp. UNC499MF TaxID=1502751 RepID=UPI00089FB5F8|nr:FadR/GntR family transcriptional regulator [Paenibacillus sp. UNC499MF]SEF83577.1 GntR family transcriptional regulator, transcriptional repressor for pyruvate dehydrogenase complex [Paenibacillus sp. UNC499MF]